ncbi:hypothetical protein Tco_1035968, partial [Tanacetum coccineum]
LPRETLVDNGCQSSPWLMHVIHIHVDIQNLYKDFSIDNALLVGQKEFIRFRVFDLLDGVPELLHKDYLRDFCSDSECLKARGVLDHINDNLKCFFLLFHSGFLSNIGRVNLDPFCRWNPLLIMTNHLLSFLWIHDSA